jgi:rfaE bifunctional protein kinase chain/domain
MTERELLPTAGRLLALVDAMAGQPVLMLVDLVADVFISGAPKRISREAPVLILTFEGERLTPGGGANAVANVAALGGRPLPLGIIGDDLHGERLRDALAAHGVSTAGVLVRRGFRTPTKVRILGGGRNQVKQQIVRYDVEDTLELSGEDRERFAAALAGWRGTARAAIVSDYGYGAVDPALLPPLRAALAPGGVLVGDSRFRLADFGGSLDGATPNEEETEALLGTRLDDDLGLLEGSCRGLLGRLGTRFLLVTRGSRGMSLFQAGSTAHLPVSGSSQVADVTGAGDTVIGTFALALAAGASPLEAALLSNYAGGVVVMKTGTATLTPDELRRVIRADPRPLEELRWAPC